MNTFLLAAAAGVLATVALGLVRVVRGPARTDRMMAAQLLGTGGLGALLLYGVATHRPAALDVALMLAVLTAFATVAFYHAASRLDDEPPPGGPGA